MSKFTNDSGIYIIKNVKNGKSYIGSAVNIRNRITTHKRELKNNTHHSSKLQNSWNKHGKQYFIFDTVEFVPDKDNLIEREQHWIDLYNSYFDGYNCCPIAGSTLGRICAEETRIKLSKSSHGNKHNLGKERSEETRRKLSESNKGKNKGKVSSFYGCKHSEESKLKMSESQKRKKPASKETREKIALARIGKVTSDETKAKLSIAQKNYWAKVKLNKENLNE